MSTTDIKTMPVQVSTRNQMTGYINEAVALRAYEVYSFIYAPQEALITGHCRGGFSTGELIAYLYAHTFPQKEWRARADEAFKEMNL